jgi:hypothetical protein
METGYCYEVWDPERGLVFKGSTRTLQNESLEEYKKWLGIFFQLCFLHYWVWFLHSLQA